MHVDSAQPRDPRGQACQTKELPEPRVTAKGVTRKVQDLPDECHDEVPNTWLRHNDVPDIS